MNKIFFCGKPPNATISNGTIRFAGVVSKLTSLQVGQTATSSSCIAYEHTNEQYCRGVTSVFEELSHELVDEMQKDELKDEETGLKNKQQLRFLAMNSRPTVIAFSSALYSQLSCASTASLTTSAPHRRMQCNTVTTPIPGPLSRIYNEAVATRGKTVCTPKALGLCPEEQLVADPSQLAVRSTAIMERDASQVKVQREHWPLFAIRGCTRNGAEKRR